MHMRPATERMDRKGNRKQQPRHGHGQLEHIDEGGGHQATSRTVDDGHSAADDAALPFGNPGDGIEDGRDRDDLCCKDCEGAAPEQDRDQRFDGLAVAKLKEVGESGEAVLLRHRPEAWAEKLREQQRSDAGRAYPPPGRESKAIAKTGCADGRAGSYIGGEKGCEESSWAEASSGNQEVGGVLHTSTDEDAERHQKDGIEEQGREI